MCSKIVQLLGQNEVDYRQKQVVIVSQDSFYRVLTSEQKSKALKGQFNFDHPGEWRAAPWGQGWSGTPRCSRKSLHGHWGSESSWDGLVKLLWLGPPVCHPPISLWKEMGWGVWYEKEQLINPQTS